MKSWKPFKADTYIRLTAALTVFAATYFNLTPFVGVDCWWHMKFGEYFLKHGVPVWFDPFAVQAEKIIAPYPNLFPGILFVKTYEAFSFPGLNLLRIGLFSLFAGVLTLLAGKSSRPFSLFFQITVLVTAMQPRVILQPDLFNYLLFTLWLFLLFRITGARRFRFFPLAGLLLLETAWVNTHPLFFYHGLFIAVVYLLLTLYRQKNSLNILLFCLLPLSIGWVFVNPLGTKALDSLLLNMLAPGYVPYSCESFSEALTYVNTHGYLLIFLLFFLQRPWGLPLSKHEKLTHFILFILLLVPALKYERCLPFPCIYLLILQAIHPGFQRKPPGGEKGIYLALAISVSLFLIVDRTYLVSPAIVRATGLKHSYADWPGLGFADIGSQEPIREMIILNQLVEQGNCATNKLQIASTAVWHAPDKPFFMHGHAAVINARVDELRRFITNLATPQSRVFLERYDIRTVILSQSNEMYLANHQEIDRNLTLIYMDPEISIFRRRDTLSAAQQERLSTFYTNFRPTILDRQRFNREEQILQFLMLWFSAQMTGNDGTHYLNTARKMAAPHYVSLFMEKMAPLLKKEESLQQVW